MAMPETKPCLIRSISTAPRPTFDDVPADAPENRLALFARNVDRAEQLSQIFRRKKCSEVNREIW